jgi:integrase
MSKIRTPKYRCQRSPNGDRAFVELNGIRHYLGSHGSEESRREYHRLLAEWSASGNQMRVAANEITIVEVVSRFWEHVKTYYVKPDGTQTSEVSNFKRALKVLKEMYAFKEASDFGPLALRAVREKMIELGWVRSSINKQIGRIKMAFRWAVAEELLSPTVYQALITVPGLKRGRCSAEESAAILPVPETHIEAIRPFVSEQVWTVVQLQLLTAARSGELVLMRGRDLNTNGAVWTYTPRDHKTSHHGKSRVIFIGPRAQMLLALFLKSHDPKDYLFSPKDAEHERRARQHAQRTTPISCGNAPSKNRVRAPKRTPGDRYTQTSYRRAIQRACRRAGIPTWHPHQLRHNAATRLRAEFGIEIAKIMLGHGSPRITEIYAETDHTKAVEVAQRVG